MNQQKQVLHVENLHAGFGRAEVIKGASLNVQSGELVAFIGPSGCGKSTLLRCLNRLHEETDRAWVNGKVELFTEDIYAPGTDPVEIRAKIGMVFQKPNPFPSMSIFDNVAAGLRIRGMTKKSELPAIVEQSLRQAALWEEVKDKLKAPGASLSGGQQQRLCIARALAIKPPVLLMDEPTSALDPISTEKIEELVRGLKKDVTIIMVTHNMQQALRVSDKTAFFYLGDLVEFAPTQELFKKPKDQRTKNYVAGRFG